MRYPVAILAMPVRTEMTGKRTGPSAALHVLFRGGLPCGALGRIH